MTKIYMFGVSEQERPLAEEWSKENNVELFLDEDVITPETIERAEGYDGVSTYQYAELGDAVYPKLKEMGIKQIAQRMAGFDPYNLELAKENDVIITNVPDYSPESIAEHTLMQALAAVRNAYTIHDKVSRHDFTETLDMRGERLGGKTVAIIGTGRIGRATAKLFDAVGCTVVGYDLYQNDEAKQYLEYKETPEEAVAEADIVSLHLPATEQTTHMVNADLISKMKDGVIVLNPGRGALVDTPALLDGLNSGKIAKAGIDTYENEFDYVKHDWSDRELEDPVFAELVDHKNVSYTPHIAYYTDESVRNMVHKALNSAMEVIETGDAKARVN